MSQSAGDGADKQTSPKPQQAEKSSPSGPGLLQRLRERDLEPVNLDLVPEMSADDIDQFLAAEEPDFFAAIGHIGSDKSLSLQQITIDDADLALLAEIESWREARGPRRLIYRVFPFAPHLSLRLKLWRFKTFAWAQGRWIVTKNFGYYLATDGRRSAIFAVRRQINSTAHQVSKRMTEFQQLKRRTRLTLFLSLLLFLTVPVIGFLGWKGRLFPKAQPLYLTSLALYASSENHYDPIHEVEPYVDNSRMAQNLYLTPKIVVNLKSSPNSTPNPMGAFEFFVEGMSSEVIVEVKDREPQMRDLLLSAIQEMTYDELDSENGKKELVRLVRKTMNSVLVTGKIKNARIKTIVIKP